MKQLSSKQIDTPLSDDELDQLADFLASAGDEAMNIEELDGFFAALIAGPELVLPSEYWPEVIGNDEFEYESIEQAHEIMALTNRHWNAIAKTLLAGDVYEPIILLDHEGVGRANAWATGFMRGVGLRSDAWQGLLDDESHAGAVIPMMMLAHENDPDPTLRPPPIPPEKREEIHVMLAAGLMSVYKYFGPLRRALAASASRVATFRREGGKVGRNGPCPCGSGKKFKHCCASASDTRH